MTTLVPVLIAGGSGSRLWPTSRQSHPKQFIDLTNTGDTFLQSALKRSRCLPDSEPWIIVTGEDYRFLVAQQAQEAAVSVGSILLEPCSRNTAPAIALAAFEALELCDSPKLLVQTADHHIQDLDLFKELIQQALGSSFPFVLFGVQPTRPETGYGYIQCGKPLHLGFEVVSFNEKPSSAIAESYVRSGNYLWNSGMFLLDAAAYLDALKRFEPDIHDACQKSLKNSIMDLDFKRIDKVEFSKSPSNSIDYAVMEKIDGLCVIPYVGDWSDVGSWDSVAQLIEKDKSSNSIQGDAILIDCQNTFVRSDSRLVTGVGLNDLLIVETRDAVLVADSGKAQHIKELVDTLRSLNRQEATDHLKVHRPWGSYETIALGNHFQVKQIIVTPEASLSLQMHNHRSEHWIVVSGTAKVQINDSERMLTEGQSVYIPLGAKHRLTNPGQVQLKIIEVQSGSYLGEDDIVRFEDNYGRDNSVLSS
jgi:mannose-1-phosphate guanylyltransferase/mannose-6-phosphate isomerase